MKEKGFSLVELLVVMAIFSVVTLLVCTTFSTLVGRGAKESRAMSSQTGGLMGLEILRSDVAHAGFALPWSYPDTIVPTWTEVSGAPAAGLGIASTAFNEVSPPRAVIAGLTNAGATIPGPHYLVLKSALLALHSPAIGHWGFVNYSGSNKSWIRTVSDPKTDIRSAQDNLITLDVSYDTQGNQTKQLMMQSASNFSYTVSFASGARATIPNSWAQTTDPTHSVFAYAISDVSHDGSPLRIPYNRADYYVDFSQGNPASCSQGTGTLMKAVAGQQGTYKDSSGHWLTYPLLNCVGDMEVVFALDMNADGVAGTYANPTDATSIGSEGVNSTTVNSTLASAALLRQQLKQVRVYILTHEGGKDANYSYPGNSINVGETGVGGMSWTSTMMAARFGSGWRNYRWKVYPLVVNMPNVQQ